MRRMLVAFFMVLGAGTLVFLSLRGGSSTPVVQAEQSTQFEPPKSSSVTIQFFGDIMLDRNVAKNMGKRGLDYIFEHIMGDAPTATQKFLGGADVTIANLEGPFARKRMPTTKSIAFRFDPKFVTDLKRYGFTAFDLANNHSYDMGRSNVAFTRETLKKANLGYFGDELNEGPAYTWFTSVRDEKLAFIGIHNTYRDPNLEQVEASIKDAQGKGYNVIAMMHWGQEYQRISNMKQRTLAHWLVDHGAVAVVGSHPHVVQETEVYKNVPIFYSLGNFVFDQYFSKDTQQGLSVVLTVDGGKVLSAEFKPLYGVVSQVHEMVGKDKEKFFSWMSENSRWGGARFDFGLAGIVNLSV